MAQHKDEKYDWKTMETVFGINRRSQERVWSDFRCRTIHNSDVPETRGRKPAVDKMREPEAPGLQEIAKSVEQLQELVQAAGSGVEREVVQVVETAPMVEREVVRVVEMVPVIVDQMKT